MVGTGAAAFAQHGRGGPPMMIQHTYPWPRRVAALLTLLVALTLPSIARAQDEEPLFIPAGQRVDGNVATMTQSIVVEGDVAGDVTSLGGDITVQGHVGGDVVSYAGRVTVRPSARVDGSVLAAGGQLQGATNAQVAGEAFGESGNGKALASVVILFMPTSSKSTPVSSISNIFFGLLVTVFLVAFSLLWAALWPRRMAATTATLRELPQRSFVLGLLSTLVLAAAMLPLTALLTMTIIGLPVVAVLLLLLQLPYIYGFAVLVQVIGADRVPAINLSGRTALIALGMAALVGVVTATLPLAGVALFYLLASPGVGAAVLSRGGVVLPTTNIPSTR